MSPPPASHEVLLIPRTFASPTHEDQVVESYKSLRLHGLKADPGSFSSTYERESQFSHELWKSRILNPSGKTFVAAVDSDESSNKHSEIPVSIQSDDSHDTIEKLLKREWVGIVTLLGPCVFRKSDDTAASPAKPWQVYIQNGEYQIHAAASATEDLSGTHLVYLIVGMFVLPQARRKGHARRLLDAAAEASQREAKARGASKATITVEVQSSNVNGKRLYEGVGYHVEEDGIAMKNQNGETTYLISLARDLELL